MNAPRHRAIALLLLLSALVACSDKVASDADYHHAPTGWTMPIPRGWRVLPPAEVERVTNKGNEMMAKALGQEIEETHDELLYLKRGQLAAFTSAAQPFDAGLGLSYEEQQDAMIEAVLLAYRSASIPVRHERSRETIGGVDFLVVSITMLAREGNAIIADQRMYDARIGDLGLTVSLTTRDLDDRDTLLAAWRASRFAPVPGPGTKAGAKSEQ